MSERHLIALMAAVIYSGTDASGRSPSPRVAVADAMILLEIVKEQTSIADA